MPPAEAEIQSGPSTAIDIAHSLRRGACGSCTAADCRRSGAQVLVRWGRRQLRPSDWGVQSAVGQQFMLWLKPPRQKPNGSKRVPCFEISSYVSLAVFGSKCRFAIGIGEPRWRPPSDDRACGVWPTVEDKNSLGRLLRGPNVRVRRRNATKPFAAARSGQSAGAKRLRPGGVLSAAASLRAPARRMPPRRPCRVARGRLCASGRYTCRGSLRQSALPMIVMPHNKCRQ